MPALAPEAQAALKPYEVDHRAEASLPPSVRSALRENVREWSGSHGFDFELLGFHFAGAPPEDVRAALAVLEAIDRPCPLPIAEKAIATLRVRTKARAGDAADTALMLAIFSEDVGDYPPDVVIDACKGWARSEKWFPAWAELKEYLDRRVKRRRLMAEALRRHLKRAEEGRP